MTVAVAAISAVCILLVLGYRFNAKNGDVEQGALLQLRSYPDAATISIDGEALSFKTPGKYNIGVGKHTVNMTLDGYQSWQKTVTVKAGELRWLNYARMVPTELQTSTAKEFPLVADEQPSPDHKWMLIQTATDKPEFTLVDLRDTKKLVYTPFTLPATSYNVHDGQTSTFSVAEWDFGARYVLVKHTEGDMVEYLRVDRTDPTQTVNISSKLGLTIQDIHFSGTSGNVFYALDADGALRKLDSGAGTISQPIVSDVASFRLFKTSTLSYVKKPVDHHIGVGIIVDGKARRIATYDDTVPVFADINEYYNDSYLAVGRGTTVVIYKNPEQNDTEKLVTLTTASAIAWLRLSSNGRFMVAGTGSQFTSYDLETSEQADVNLPGTAADTSEPLQWLDDYYLVSTTNNDVHLTEFDGTNQHIITSTIPGYAVTISGDAKYLYSIGRTESGSYALQATQMVISK